MHLNAILSGFRHLISRDVGRENRFDEEREARELKAHVERQLADSNIRFETPLEHIRLMIRGRKRIRFYNPLKEMVIVWIYENPEALVVKKKKVGVHGSIEGSISLEVGGGVTYERTGENRSSVNPEGLPITVLTVAPTVTIPVYVQSDEVYVTFGVHVWRNDGGLDTVILQHARLLPTSSIFTFRSYHLKHPIGVIRSSVEASGGEEEDKDYPDSRFIHFYAKDAPNFWESEFGVKVDA